MAKPSPAPMIQPRLGAAALILSLLMAGCAIEWQNRQPAVEAARQARPPGSTYTGWRVFQAKCASCHGTDARGGAGGGPDLLPRVREMGARRFVGLVLQRYDWTRPTAPAAGSQESLVEQMLQRQEPAVTMPAWGGEPEVSAHIADLYAYLSARAQDTLGPGRPAP